MQTNQYGKKKQISGFLEAWSWGDDIVVYNKYIFILQPHSLHRAPEILGIVVMRAIKVYFVAHNKPLSTPHLSLC